MGDRPNSQKRWTFNRRAFVRYGSLGIGASLVSGLAIRVGTQWWDQESNDSYRVLSSDEVKIVDAMADAMFPGEPLGSRPKPMPNGVAVGLTYALDTYLASIDQSTANLIRVLIHAIDDGGVVADLGMTKFRNRSRAERIEILDAWDRSFFASRRGAFRSLKILLSTAYCEHPSVLDAAGIKFSCGGVV